jgi:hypothetical protein
MVISPYAQSLGTFPMTTGIRAIINGARNHAV